MNLGQLQAKLLQSARSQPISDAVPYAFEKRILARLKSLAKPDPWAAWGRALWRAAAPCVAVSVLLGAWSWFTPTGSAPTIDLSQEMENTVLAAIEQSADLNQ